MKKIVVALFALLFSLAQQAFSQKINAEEPTLEQSVFRLDSMPISEINVPIQINLKPIYALAEKTVDTLFTSPQYPNNWVQNGCATRYKYTFRRGPLQMKASGNSLTLSFIGYYKIIGSTRVCVGGTAISPWTPPCRCGFEEPERRVHVSFTNSVFVQPDYTLKLVIKRNEPQPLDKCEVCFWGQDVTNDVLKGLNEELDASKAELEKNYGTVNLRSKFQQVWDQLSKAYDLNSMGWLKINPQRIRINSLYAKNDSLNVNLGLAAKPVAGFEKPADFNTRLPNITDFSNKVGFNIFLDAVLNYDSLTNILNAQVIDREFDLDKGLIKKKFIIKECKLYGADNEKLIIQMKFAGSNKGTIYLTGKPVYDPVKKQMEITNIDFDIKSKNALLRAADWLFNKKIVNEISKYAKYDLSTYIDSAKTVINQQLNREWVKGVYSQGNMNDIRLIGIFPSTKHLIIRSNCSGQLAVIADSIDFSL